MSKMPKQKPLTKTAQAQADLDAIIAWTGPDYLKRPEAREQLKAQNIDVEKLNTKKYFPVDDEDTEENGDEETEENDDEDTEEITESETGDESIDALNRDVEAMENAHKQRLTADKLKQDKTQPLKATQQKAADELQKNLAIVQNAQKSTIGKVRENVNKLTEKIGGVATPGGLALPFMIMMALIIFLVKVQGKNGDAEPRFIWSWLVLTRKAKLIPESQIPEKIFNPPHEQTSTNNNTSDNADNTVDAVIIMPQIPSQFSRYFSE